MANSHFSPHLPPHQSVPGSMSPALMAPSPPRPGPVLSLLSALTQVAAEPEPVPRRVRPQVSVPASPSAQWSLFTGYLLPFKAVATSL